LVKTDFAFQNLTANEFQSLFDTISFNNIGNLPMLKQLNEHIVDISSTLSP